MFAFSKKDCESLALQLSQIDVNESHEKKLVEGIFSSALECLSDADRQLPQVSCHFRFQIQCTNIHCFILGVVSFNVAFEPIFLCILQVSSSFSYRIRNYFVLVSVD